MSWTFTHVCSQPRLNLQLRKTLKIFINVFKVYFDISKTTWTGVEKTRTEFENILEDPQAGYLRVLEVNGTVTSQ